MKFLCDRMLGTLAKWLRIFGFDTLFADSNIEDEKLLKLAKDEERILITCDKNLIIDARRENIKVIKIISTDINDQLRQVLKNTKIDENFFLSRCLLCNNLVEKISKKNVKKIVPDRVYENNKKFWYCKICDKIYWKGSHFENMIQKIKQL
ncbi:MAG: hypothetical protein BV457_04185 [Thermoplasmata archaeon M9B1D]|nr:MAG: hypothetical protein BV457_04185 [Thermoplasmata archaeon M9B1D]PNX51287.1 MAG: hypothetical protein BV456_03780 [Thermoplasmata archaeon M8B2D]